MLINNTIKLKVYEAIQAQLIQNKQLIINSLNDLTNDAKNDTKSTAGDKHETGRAMMQHEQEKLRLQLVELENQISFLQKINPENKAEKIQLGSMVQTDKACFYIAIAFGQIAIDDTNIFVISSIAPIAQQMLGKSINDQFEMNGLTYKVSAIV
jgi:transcription elongation GreA/GreB family factor